jgi:hypothetical protein
VPSYVPPIAPQAVLQDAQRNSSTPEPAAMLQVEREYIAERRRSAWVTRRDSDALAALALSGGGIRSATFALGVTQALARADLLRQFDYLSTVSGGGYLGSSLIWWLSGMAGNGRPFGLAAGNFPYGTDPPHCIEPPRDEEDQQQTLRYLRQRGEYLVPGGGISLVSGVAAVLRGIVLNLTILAVFLVAGLAFAELAVDRTLGRAEWAAGFYVEVMERLSGLLALLTPGTDPPALGPTPVLYQVLITLMLLPMLAFLIFAFGYAFYSRLRTEGRENYPLRRWAESWAGRCIAALAALFLVGTLPFFYHWAGPLLSMALSLAGAAAGLAAALSRFLARRRGDRSLLSGDAVVKTGAALLLYALLLAAYATTRALFPAPGLCGVCYFWLGGLTALALLFSLAVNINHISLHRFYRDRLMEAFLPDWSTVRQGRSRAVRGADGLPLSGLAVPGRQAGAPLHLINCNAVLVDSPNATWSERGGDSFVLSALYCGGGATGWRRSGEFMGGRMSLATAMAVSGAAANPNAVGVTRSRLVSLLMALLNLRLGIWVPHPRPGVPQWARPNPIVPGLSQVFRFGGLGYQERTPFLHLSDGGHFENLALYELIRRKARLIVLSDGAADPQFAFEDFTRLCRRAAMDFGAVIDASADDGLKRVCPDKKRNFGWPAKRHPAAAGWLEAAIRYADGSTGQLIYIKATLIEGLPPAVLGYAKANRVFPHQTTADQWFDEEQFEAYRQLGFHLASRMIAEARLPQRLAAL